MQCLPQYYKNSFIDADVRNGLFIVDIFLFSTCQEKPKREVSHTAFEAPPPMPEPPSQRRPAPIVKKKKMWVSQSMSALIKILWCYIFELGTVTVHV